MTNENIPNEVQMAIDAAPKQLAGKVITKEAIDEFINIFKPMLVTKENIKLARKMIEEESVPAKSIFQPQKLAD